ncbi:hypothetical protein TSOC_010845 [Tetrabaena socialis]|uniref:ShKT domain-containing protein n=1 Tax=Tetrabaena socialis TaxID=47790 RepID=A0A2J7ZSA0_9CHLO|nr:hypothetical protein TSOC_010845 [Tetrabaena socialis]|eukprot:PNH03138.1 hypothetical protein TSOC_010845 [Tetrabaena socialis]
MVPSMIWFALALTLAAPSLGVENALMRENAFETWSEDSKPKDCRDAESACSDWAAHGECAQNPKFMFVRCPLACQRCTAPEVRPADYAGQALLLNCSLGMVSGGARGGSGGASRGGPALLGTRDGAPRLPAGPSPASRPGQLAPASLSLCSRTHQIRILPYLDRAPATASLVLELAHQRGCKGCAFYRNEAVPQAQEGSGPPYGLLQGSLAGMLRVPSREGGNIAMRRGHVAMIPDTREFFINVMDHVGWGDSMTVWGELDGPASMSVVEAALRLPYHDVKHPTFGTVMRMLDEQVPFLPLPETAAEGAVGKAGGGAGAGVEA